MPRRNLGAESIRCFDSRARVWWGKGKRRVSKTWRKDAVQGVERRVHSTVIPRGCIKLNGRCRGSSNFISLPCQNFWPIRPDDHQDMIIHHTVHLPLPTVNIKQATSRKLKRVFHLVGIVSSFNPRSHYYLTMQIVSSQLSIETNDSISLTPSASVLLS